MIYNTTSVPTLHHQSCPSLTQNWAQTCQIQTANQDGFALGRLFKSVVIDPTARLWEAATWYWRGYEFKVNSKIHYRVAAKQLEHFHKHLDRNLHYLCKNPKNPHALLRIERLFKELDIWKIPVREGSELETFCIKCQDDIINKILALNNACVKRAILGRLISVIPICGEPRTIFVEPTPTEDLLPDDLPRPINSPLLDIKSFLDIYSPRIERVSRDSLLKACKIPLPDDGLLLDHIGDTQGTPHLIPEKTHKFRHPSYTVADLTQEQAGNSSKNSI